MKRSKNIRKLLSMALVLTLMFCGCGKGNQQAKETDEITHGIDVARYQGTIDWQQVANSNIDFAMIRVGYRANADGVIKEDPNGRFNLQEASKAGIHIGAYFFSTAVSEEEAREEAAWLADILSGYPITYPVVYDCEDFHNPESRQYLMTRAQRTDVALAFLETIETLGYEGMFYGSKNDLQLDNAWETSRIEADYKIWVAQYPDVPYPDTPASSYAGLHHMWQYSMSGTVPGISQPVDLNVAYFGYDGVNPRKDRKAPEEVEADREALMDFTQVDELVTAKSETNLRDIPSQDIDSQVLASLKNGEVAQRIAISSSGWSKLVYQGSTYYAVSSYLTTDLGNDSASVSGTEPDSDGIKTRFEPMNDRVTPKDNVNLRSLPSVEHPDCVVVANIKKGEVVTRTGINRDVGWSRVEYNGQTLYCVSSYLTAAE